MKGLSTLFAGAALLVGGAVSAQTPPTPGHEGHNHPPTPAHTPFDAGGKNDWFDKTRIDLGTFYEEETAVGKFKFTNPRKAEHKISNLAPSCQCSKAVITVGDRKYEIGADKILYKVTKDDGVESKDQVGHITVGPEEEGEVEVHMTMTNIRGNKEAELGMQTSDPALPVVSLKWRATGAVYFVVNPPEVHLNEMTWADKREFEFTITSPLKKDFNLLSHEPLSTGMQVEYEKEMKDGRAVWRVKGTYGPGALERDKGGLVRFKTDVHNRVVTGRVSAFLVGPLTVKPGGFVSLGNIKSAEGKEAEVTLTPNGGFDLQVEKLEVTRLKMTGRGKDQKDSLQFSHRKDGNDVKVMISVAKGMQPAYFTGVLKVHLNHPAAPVKEVMFNGFIRNR